MVTFIYNDGDIKDVEAGMIIMITNITVCQRNEAKWVSLQRDAFREDNCVVNSFREWNIM